LSLNDRARAGFKPREVRDAYARVFSGPHGSLVLAHLADACGATRTTFDSDLQAMAVAEGRRQVWLVIQDVLSINEADLREMQAEVGSREGL